MTQIIIKFKNGQHLVYDLKNTPVVSRWVYLMSTVDMTMVSPRTRMYESHHGFASKDLIDTNVALLRHITAK